MSKYDQISRETPRLSYRFSSVENQCRMKNCNISNQGIVSSFMYSLSQLNLRTHLSAIFLELNGGLYESLACREIS